MNFAMRELFPLYLDSFTVWLSVMIKPPSKHETFTQCWIIVGPASKTWANCKPTPDQRLTFDESRLGDEY